MFDEKVTPPPHSVTLPYWPWQNITRIKHLKCHYFLVTEPPWGEHFEVRLARHLALRAANSCAILVFSRLRNIILAKRELGLLWRIISFTIITITVSWYWFDMNIWDFFCVLHHFKKYEGVMFCYYFGGMKLIILTEGCVLWRSEKRLFLFSFMHELILVWFNIVNEDPILKK